MARGPICAEANPSYIRSPGPIGCNGWADMSEPNLDLWKPKPLGLDYKAVLQANGTATKKKGSSIPIAVVNLKKPEAATIQQLSKAIEEVKKLNAQYETSGKQKDEALRLKKEKVLKDIVKAYGVGLLNEKELEFDNRTDSGTYADTRGTFIIAYDAIFVHPGFVASVILHESSHAERNAELKKAGFERNQLGFIDADKWSAIIEFEGYHLEIENAAKTGISKAELDHAKAKRIEELANIKLLLGEAASKDAENGNLDRVRAKFIASLQAKP